MISHDEKRAALSITQVDIDTAAERTAFALTCKTRGLYFEHVRDRLSEAMACAVFAAEIPCEDDWRTGAMEDFVCEWFERMEERA